MRREAAHALSCRNLPLLHDGHEMRQAGDQDLGTGKQPVRPGAVADKCRVVPDPKDQTADDPE